MSTIGQILTRTQRYSDDFNFIRNLHDASSSTSGYSTYYNIVNQVNDYTSVMHDFLSSLKVAAASTTMSATQIITSAETLINQMISIETIKTGIQTQITNAGWSSQYSISNTVFDSISTDLKTIFGALIVICNVDQSQDAYTQADSTLLTQLRSLNSLLINFDVIFMRLEQFIIFIQTKQTRWQQALLDFSNVFGEIVDNYQQQLNADITRITSKNSFFSNRFSTMILQVRGGKSAVITHDSTDKNVLIDGVKYDFSTMFLSPLTVSPTYFKIKTDDLMNLIRSNVAGVSAAIMQNGLNALMTFYNQAMNGNIDSIFNCVMSPTLGEQFDLLISNALDGVRALATRVFFSVVPFSRVFADQYDIATKMMANTIANVTTMADLKTALRAVNNLF